MEINSVDADEGLSLLDRGRPCEALEQSHIRDLGKSRDGNITRRGRER
jgi:hypothetical protein